MRKPTVAESRSQPMRAPRRQMRLQGLFRAASGHLRTVRDLVRFAVTRFEEAKLSYGHGSDNALDEAAYLVVHALRLPIDRLDAFMDACVLPQEADEILRLLQRRVTERLPAAYLTHEAWIGGHRFYVDERVIVPRSYIGRWLDGDPAPWIERAEAIESVLDLCTGSGCLAVLLAEAFPAARVDAVDISSDALQVARQNVAMHGLEPRIRLLQGDLFSGLLQRRYDLIAVNPPYVTAAAMKELPPEYRHEPRISLAGGEDGLDVVRRIVAQAHAHLAPGGLLVMEVGHARSRVEAAFPRLPFTWLDIDGVDDAVLLLRRDQLPARGARR